MHILRSNLPRRGPNVIDKANLKRIYKRIEILKRKGKLKDSKPVKCKYP